MSDSPGAKDTKDVEKARVDFRYRHFRRKAKRDSWERKDRGKKREIEEGEE